MDNSLKVYVLFRFSKRTGKIDTTMTGLGSAMMKLWALQNTTKTKDTVIIDRDNGNIIAAYSGDSSGFPKVKENTGNCVEYGIPLELLQEIKDDRFD